MEKPVKKIFVISMILAALALGGCQAAGNNPQVVGLQDKVATLEARVSESQGSAGSDMEARLSALEEHLSMDTMAGDDQVFMVVLTNYLVENTGFHEMAETLQEAEQIPVEYLGMVSRIRGVVATAPWPEELKTQSSDFVDQLDSFVEALQNDDLEAARPTSDEVHDAQHEFSEAIGDWLSAHASAMEMEGMMVGTRIPNVGGATIHIQSPANGDMIPFGEDVPVEVEVANFNLDDGGNHWHIYVDGELAGMVVGGDLVQVLSGLEPGEHEISVYLSNGNHEEFEEGDSIMLVVQDGA
jgi:hypothetical protein